MTLRDKVYSIEYISIGTESYLMVLPQETGQIVDYQMKMVAGNKVKCLLAMTCKNVNLSVELYYNITSKISLQKYLSRKQFTRKEYIVFLLNFVNRIYELKNYLLNETKILLDVNNIYIEMDAEKVFFTYLPIKDYENDYVSFFTELIVNNSQFLEESQCDNYLQKLIMLLKSNNFCISGMKQLLERLLKENEQSSYDDNSINESICAINTPEPSSTLKRFSVREVFDKNVMLNGYKKEVNYSKKEIRAVCEEDKPVSGYEGIKTTQTPIKIPGNLQKEASSNQIKIQNILPKPKLTKGNFRPKVLFVILQPLFFVAFYFIVNSGLVAENDDYTITLVILSFIFIALDVLLFRFLKSFASISNTSNQSNHSNEPQNKRFFASNHLNIPQNKKSFASKINTTNQSNHSIDTQNKPAIASKSNTTIQNNNSNEPQNNVVSSPQNSLPSIIQNKVTINNSNQYSQDNVSIPYSGDTEVIRIEKNTVPLLKQNMGTDIITLSKPSLIIGRMSGFVDHVLAVNSIGKIHAEITCENGEIFISDLNSKNGTFINEIKIPPNAKTKVVSGDIIRFANVEYELIS